jgi:Gpi18-like mannosyltransferase
MERADAKTAALTRSERLALLALLGFAAALRWLAWSRTVTLFNDGPEFLELAKSAAAGEWDAVLSHPYHPLYSLLVACVHAVGFDWESAGALVGVAGGTAAVAFLFLFVRDAFGAPAAWIGAGLLALHSRAVEFSSDIQSDGLYLGLFLAGVWFGWRAWTRRARERGKSYSRPWLRRRPSSRSFCPWRSWKA